MNRWDHRFLDMAQLVSTWSKDPSTKCGAVIVRPDKTVASVGFNGFPPGCDDSSVIYENRELKYSRIVHAETNAILHAREPLEGYSIYTYPAGGSGACDRCATAIITSGIKRIIHYLPPKGESFGGGRWEKAEKSALQMFDEAGIEVVGYQLELPIPVGANGSRYS